MHLVKHLAAQFPALPLESGLFHRWNVALRFELDTKHNNLPLFAPLQVGFRQKVR